MKLFDKMKEIESKAAPIEKWTGSMNYPFNGYLDQPRPSLSKHEGTKLASNMLHCDDLSFILTSRRDMPKLLEALNIAMEYIEKQSKSECYVMCSCMENAEDVLKKIEAINEES